MFTVRRHHEFNQWLNGLRDAFTRARLIKRIERAERGLLGDVKPAGEGVFEMREDFGPGWRMYYIQRGQAVILMLGGGDKSTQAADIKVAIAMAKTIED
ncbi:MAG: type II toxin-antitoxin system RelE/ParE family toxin [Desulfovibrionaceae bacterium]|jgi:putative addiction module killer protein|nr:type II toxin-antitoxin system RelE/ParE family toxin [Desulfovibrionaceae bacterium]